MSTAETIETADILIREDSDGIARLTLNRPGARNALSIELMQALLDELKSIAQDKSVKCIVLAANGPAFCAGHDLKDMRAHGQDRAYFESVFATCSELMKSVVRQPQVVIARVSGIATAAGLQLMASCDLAVAEENTKFATPGVNIGLFCSTPMVAVSRNIGRKQMMEMLVLGEMIDAETALNWGLINRAVPADKLDEIVNGFAATICSKSPLSLKIGKEAFYRQMEMPLDEAYDYASQVMTENMLARDAEEGIDAFINKRQPVWRGE